MQSGAGELESVFGRLPVGAGDYVVVPTGVTHRWVVADDAPAVELLVLSSRSHIEIPRKYLTATGSSPRVAVLRARPARVPTEPLLVDGRRRRGARAHPRRVRPSRPPRPPLRRRRLGRLRVPVGVEHPRLRTDRRRLHQPPPVHQTFAGAGFVVCSFVPRLYDFDPGRGQGAVPPLQRRLRRGAVLLAPATS